MESYQPPYHYMRPPPAPPSMASDPQYSHPPPPPSPSNSWYPGQFQYHHAPQSPSPPPPPPQQQHQWGHPPPPPPHPYPAHHHQSPYSAPPPQHYPPHPPPPYPNQDWGNANWTHHSTWENPGAHNNEEDWAAKARAWASARSAVDCQQPQSQYSSATRPDDPSNYANQYPPPVKSHYQDIQHTSVPTSGFSNYQGPVASLHRPTVINQQEPESVSSYASELQMSVTVKDGTLGGDSSAAFTHHQGQSNSSVHQQEVPSSYSSIPGKEDNFRGKQHGNSLLPADCRSMPLDHAQFAYGNHSLDLMDQPLEFAPRFSHENGPKMTSIYPDSTAPVRGTDSVASVASLHSWTAPAAPGASYPPISPLFPSATQHDPVGISLLPGQPSPLFGAVSGFQPPVPSMNTPLGLSAALHPAAAFPVDAYGVSLGPERSKKDALPNWLKEEIIKTKATIANSTTEHFKDGSQLFEDDLVDKTTEKVDQADSKSMDSARSTEEEEDDEDEVEAQRTAVINQEIKRVLTEVLLKVTDELFDEIATKVLSEDDNAVTDSDNGVSVPKMFPPPPPVSTNKASAKFLTPVNAKGSEERPSGGSSSGSLGNVLGLANYASDEDDEIHASSVPISGSSGVHSGGENDHVQIKSEHEKIPVYSEANHSNGGLTGFHANHGTPSSKINVDRVMENLDNSDYSRGAVSREKNDDTFIGDTPKSTDNGHKETLNRPDELAKKLGRRSARNDSQERGVKRHESRSSSGRDSYKERESRKGGEVEKDESHGRDERHKKKDKTEDIKRDRAKDKKERSPPHAEKFGDAGARKASPNHEGKEGKYERRERDRKRSSKDDGDSKRGRAKEERGEKSRHKSSEGSRHKRRRSSSIGRVKSSKESPVRSDGSSDVESEGSRRKVHSKRRNLSPSPTRSRRRKVPRSPHSKHTQRRHSPYPSLDDNRERSRSRSRSPVRRNR